MIVIELPPCISVNLERTLSTPLAALNPQLIQRHPCHSLPNTPILSFFSLQTRVGVRTRHRAHVGLAALLERVDDRGLPRFGTLWDLSGVFGGLG